MKYENAKSYSTQNLLILTGRSTNSLLQHAHADRQLLHTVKRTSSLSNKLRNIKKSVCVQLKTPILCRITDISWVFLILKSLKHLY